MSQEIGQTGMEYAQDLTEVPSVLRYSDIVKVGSPLADLQYNTLRKGSDQTPFNYLIRQMGCDINYLPKIYNMTSLHRKGILDAGLFIEIGNIWHFNGFDKESRVVLMKQTWENIRGNYE